MTITAARPIETKLNQQMAAVKMTNPTARKGEPIAQLTRWRTDNLNDTAVFNDTAVASCCTKQSVAADPLLGWRVPLDRTAFRWLPARSAVTACNLRAT
jgi:hypothetical protein